MIQQNSELKNLLFFYIVNISPFLIVIRHVLTPLWANTDNRIQVVDFTYCDTSKDPFAYSTIDHFAVNQHMLEGVVMAGVYHDGSHIAKHSPIIIKFEVDKIDLSTEKFEGQTRVSWNMACADAKENFRYVFENKLQSVSYDTICQDIHCKSESHMEKLEEFTLSTLVAMESAGVECLPNLKPGKKKKDGTPGWNIYVKPYAEESKFWHGLWAAVGKPRTGELFIIMKSKKLHYKYAVRRLKRCLDILKNDKFIESISDDNKCIFQEVRRLRKKKNCLSSRIDDSVGSTNIANHFSTLYSELFNSRGEDDIQLQTLDQNINSKIN